jgi:phenylpropionate dioxygenase-like ring-hydroxylating dioxygenase large terminal subunit
MTEPGALRDEGEGAAEPERLWREALVAVGGAAPQRGAPARSPVGRYLDPERHRAELAALRRWPHAVAPAARVAAPGDWVTAQLLGVPILLVRGDDGELRAFINVCRHRGALVAAPESCGAARSRFVCPYHSWTYDASGRLVGRPHEDDFPHVPRETAGLVDLPVTVACGLVWVIPQQLAGFDWQAHFGALGAELGRLGYDGAAQSPHERRFVQPSNWKLVLDANLESYHFQYAHRATIAHLFHDNVVQQASFGNHQRIVLPKRSLAESGASSADWEQLGRHANIIYFFFPSTFLLWEGDHANAFNVTPRTAESCATASWMVVPAAQHERRSASHWERNWTIFWDAIDEDFALAAAMQSGLASGANASLAFGANEFACELFERAVDALVAEAGPGDQRSG